MSGARAFRLLVVLLLSLVAHAVFASSGAITGFVSVKGPDAPNQPIANAFVNLTDCKFTRQVLAVGKTNAQGFFSISGLSAGKYQVTVTAPGFLQGIVSSFQLKGGETVSINAQLVPFLDGDEIEKKNEKDETSWTIHNPNNFAVHYKWVLRQHKATGTGVAYPGDNILETGAWPHSEHIALYVDGIQVKERTTTDIPPPVITSKLTGYVDGPGNAPLGGVEVDLIDSGGNPVGTEYTAADGSYAFTNEDTGNYKLTYSLSGYVSASQLFTLSSKGGQAPTIVLSLVPPPPTATLNVTVTDPSGPVPGASVAVVYADNETSSGITDGNGYISLSQQPVAIAGTITATANDGSGRSASTTTSGLAPGANAIAIQLPAIPRGAVSGQVTDSVTAGPLGNVTVSVLDASANSVAFTTTASDGSYTIGNIAPGTYTMTFSLQGYQTASVGGIIVTSGGNTSESVTLVSNTVSVTIDVLDGDTGQAWTGGGSTTIQYMDGTQTGPVAEGAQGETVIPNQAENVGATITFTSSDGRTATQSYPSGFTTPVTVTLTLPVHPAIISGTVFDATSLATIPGASITVVDSTNNVTYTATTDGHGLFSIGNVTPGDDQMTVTASGYQGYTSDVQAQPNQTADLKVALEPSTATVTVSVIDGGTGMPLTAGTVQMLYSDSTFAGPISIQPDGTAVFTGQELGVPVQVTAMRTDGSAGAASSQGWTPGANSITVNLAPEVLTGDIAGTITDSTTRLPIAGASVSATDVSTTKVEYATTDGSGYYDIVGLPTSKFTMAVTAKGYQDASNGGVNVSSGKTTVVNIALTPTGGGGKPTATVTVTVLDNGVPAFGASVQISYNDHTVSNTVVTGLNGVATFTGQETGISGAVTAVAGDKSGRTASTFFMDWIAGNNSTTVNLPAAGTTGTVTGVVVDASTGLALVGVNVQAYAPGGGPTFNFTTSKTGQFSSALPAANYVLTFTLSGYQSVSVDSIPITAGQTTNVGTVQMTSNAQALATVVVTVADPSTMKPVANASVTIQYSPGIPGIPTLLTDSNGQVTFTNQPVGVQYTVVASTADGRTGSSAASKGGFVAGNNSVTVYLTGTTTATISGTVVDAATQKSLANATVVATDAKGAIAAQTTSAIDGSYSLTVNQGAYNVTFSDNGYQSQTYQVTAPSTLNVKLEPAATDDADVNVTVLDGNGDPMVGASVDISYSDGSPSVDGMTDGNGNVSFTGQPSGVQATVSATSADKSVSASQVTTFASGANAATLTLVAMPGAISGSVADATTKTGLAGATVTVVDWNGMQVTKLTTDKSGNYSVTGLVAGSYAVTIDDPGYVSQTVTVPVQPGKTSTANVWLYPNTATVTVTVLAPNGNGFAGVPVTITYTDGTQAYTDTVTGGIAIFNNQPAGLGATISAVDNAYSGSLSVPAGFVVGPNAFTVQMQTPATTVVGVVTDLATGAPVSGASVTIKDPGGAVLGTTTTASDGSYEIDNLRDDTVYDVVSAPNYATSQTTIPELYAGQTITQNVQLSGISSMAVFVVDTTGAPVAGAQVNISFKSGATTSTQTTDANGLATIGSLPEGYPCTVNVQIIDPTTHKIVQTVNVPIANLTLGANSVTVTVQAINPMDATVSIYVVDDENGGSTIPDGTVAIYYGTDTTPAAIQTTDNSGIAQFSGLKVGVPGTILVSTPDGRLQTQSFASLVSGANSPILIAIN